MPNEAISGEVRQTEAELMNAGACLGYFKERKKHAVELQEEFSRMA